MREDSNEDVDENQIINALRNISEVKLSALGYRFE